MDEIEAKMCWELLARLEESTGKSKKKYKKK